jgi:hypothetical protein
MSVTVDTVVVATDEQISADLDGEAVVLGMDKGMYYGLGGVGGRIWELLCEPRSVSDIRDTIVGEYDIDEATCLRDIIGFLERLDAEGLLVVTDETAG